VSAAKPAFMGDAMQEFVFCIEKYGEYTFQSDHRARLIAESASFEEMRALLSAFETMIDGEAKEETLDNLALCLGSPVPRLDRMLRWPWNEEYE
ncbi:hypothetical protein, partial [Mesorhizobium sp. M1C.F.Ca.ET.188.01.1.1]|uniref:hypothetical protein n=1 Tax=Mesorhizobium sp. M1C.F.Ca.ET.188.01.1.1 TaxID=2563924 RepID=UPI001672C229